MLTPLQRHQIAQEMGGVPIGQLVKGLFHAIDGEALEQKARENAGVPADADPGDTARKNAQQHLVAAAPRLAPLRVWDAYARLDASPLTELTALIALIRRACGIDRKLLPFADTVRRNYRDWIVRENAGNPFTAEQTAWLQLIRDHVMTSVRLDREDLKYAPFDAQGGLGKMCQLFGDRMDPLIEELNQNLTA
jgi:type I restriction enzyme R subunit